MDTTNIKWDDKGLIPAIIQDSISFNVLMLGYMNKESLDLTLSSKEVTFFSRSRQKIWTKGETSGNKLIMQSIEIDCDNDTLLIKASPLGPTCHLEKYSCFGLQPFSLQKLEKIIKTKIKSKETNSYTKQLLTSGNKEIAKKIAEEANELAISAVTNDGRLLDEASDLMYHLQVLLAANNYTINDLEEALAKRDKGK